MCIWSTPFKSYNKHEISQKWPVSTCHLLQQSDCWCIWRLRNHENSFSCTKPADQGISICSHMPWIPEQSQLTLRPNKYSVVPYSYSIYMYLQYSIVCKGSSPVTGGIMYTSSIKFIYVLHLISYDYQWYRTRRSRKFQT